MQIPDLPYPHTLVKVFTSYTRNQLTVVFLAAYTLELHFFNRWRNENGFCNIGCVRELLVKHEIGTALTIAMTIQVRMSSY